MLLELWNMLFEVLPFDEKYEFVKIVIKESSKDTTVDEIPVQFKLLIRSIWLDTEWRPTIHIKII